MFFCLQIVFSLIMANESRQVLLVIIIYILVGWHDIIIAE